MKRVMGLFVLLVLIGMAPGAWAGPKEEVAQSVEEWFQAFHAGNAEALGAMYAEDAQLFAALSPFRADGRGAIQAFWAGFFQAFPTRRVVIRQDSTQFYGTTAVSAGYFTLTQVDRAGQARTAHGRYSLVRVKQGDRWLVVSHHTSLLPASP